MQKLYTRIGVWLGQAFPGATAQEHITKLITEAKELHDNPRDIMEYADCIIAILGAAYKEKFTYHDLVMAVDDKLRININRRWIKQPDGTYQHTELTHAESPRIDLIIAKTNDGSIIEVIQGTPAGALMDDEGYSIPSY